MNIPSMISRSKENARSYLLKRKALITIEAALIISGLGLAYLGGMDPARKTELTTRPIAIGEEQKTEDRSKLAEVIVPTPSEPALTTPTPEQSTPPAPPKTSSTPKPTVPAPAKPAPAIGSPQPAPATPHQPASQPSPSAPVQPAGINVAGIAQSINREREGNGLSAVSLNAKLNRAATAKARDMAEKNYFAHTSPDGTTDWYFIDQSDYRYNAAGVNLAMGSFGSSDALVQAWMNSPGHKANILASFGQEIGIGISGKYYVMIIARPA